MSSFVYKDGMLIGFVLKLKHILFFQHWQFLCMASLQVPTALENYFSNDYILNYRPFTLKQSGTS